TYWTSGPGRVERCRSDGHGDSRRCAGRCVFRDGSGAQSRVSEGAAGDRRVFPDAIRRSHVDNRPRARKSLIVNSAIRRALILSVLGLAAPGVQQPGPDLEAMPFAPKQYVVYRARSPIKVDGSLDDASWAAAPWTDSFVDIEGPSRPQPRFRTRARMLWDDENLYVAAEMEEPDVWSTLTDRDSVIFHNNDFEIFIDPDGDTHAY